MKLFHLTLIRSYFALAALIAAFLIHRPLINSHWDAHDTLQAGAADLLILLVLACIHWGTSRWAVRAPTLARLSGWLHGGIVALLATLVVSSQLLFVKTGEILDFSIIEFAVRDAAMLGGVVSGEFNRDAAQPVVLAVLFFVLAGLNLSRATNVMARGALALPIVLLPVGLMAGGPSGAEAAVVESDLPKGALYRGAYTDLNEHYRRWNASSRDGWQRGILAGMSFGSAFGRLEYEALRARAGVESIYEAPAVIASSRRDRPNVLMILLESVRHDVIGAYRTAGGAAGSVTPFIDRFARQSRVVERAYTTIPHTSKALVGIYCGTFPRFDPEIVEGLPGGLEIPCLPQLLRKAGYRSAHFQTAPARFENRDQLLTNMGFDHFTTQESFNGQQWERFAYLGMDDRAMVGPAVRWMSEQRAAGLPFFASLLTVTTHHPYVSPGNVRSVATPEEAYRAYLTGLAYTDRMLEELFGELERAGLLENTLVIITGDHGEGFAEHGALAHNGNAYEEGMRVPLIVRLPATRSTEPIPGLRQHIDLMPTILEVAGVRWSGRLPGRSLLSDPNGHDRIVTSCFYEDYCLTQVDKAGGKLAYFYGRRALESFDLGSDPAERRNLIEYDPGAAAVDERLLSAVRLRNAYADVWQERR